MFNVGAGELMVILVVALLVLGPKQLPAAARQLGRARTELTKFRQRIDRETKALMDLDTDPTVSNGSEPEPVERHKIAPEPRRTTEEINQAAPTPTPAIDDDDVDDLAEDLAGDARQRPEEP